MQGTVWEAAKWKKTYMSIAKGGERKLDTPGPKPKSSFHNMDIDFIHKIIQWDLRANTPFMIGGETWSQDTGVAIGGPMSGQHADIALMGTESNIRWGTAFSEDLWIGKYQGNIFCLRPAAE